MKNLLIPAKDYRDLIERIAMSITINRQENIEQFSCFQWLKIELNEHIRQSGLARQMMVDVVDALPAARENYKKA